MECEGGKACGFAARTTSVDAEAISRKRMADCSETARAISKRGSGLRAILTTVCVYACVLLLLWCEPRWGKRLLLATVSGIRSDSLASAHLIPKT